MQSLKCAQIIKATKGILISGDESIRIKNISTDSRNISKGDLFIPLVGERFDGHDFIEDVFINGASAVLTQKDIASLDIDLLKGKTVIKVKDTLRALGDISKAYRLKHKIPFVGITGSVGKTSTKEMISSVLSEKYKTLKNKGNYNNEIGVPLTLLNLDQSHQAAVIEMGMSDFGEISRLTFMVRPDIAVITNIGLSHIEKLGSRQNILKAKMEILESMDKSGVVVLNGDDNLLDGLRDLLNFKTVFYGTEDNADYQAYNIMSAGENGMYFEVSVNGKEYKIHLHVPGMHNVYNALAAIAVGVEMDVPMDDILKGLSKFCPEKMRMNIISKNGIKIINDAYNANPQSMEAALGVLKDIGGEKRKIAILGDMLEMGEFARESHVNIGKFAVSKGIEYIIAIGKNANNTISGALEQGARENNVFMFDSNEEAKGFLKKFISKGDYILVKGSRGMKMEEIVESLTVEN